MNSWFKTLFNIFCYLLAMAIILLAILVQAARWGVVHVDEYKGDIESFLSQRLGADVAMGRIEAEWSGLRPSLAIVDFEIRARRGVYNGESVLSASDFSLVLDLSDSFLNFTPVFKTISGNNFQVALEQSEAGLWSVAGFDQVSTTDKVRWQYRRPLDFFRTIQFASINEALVDFTFLNGDVLSAQIPELNIQNQGENHRLSASAFIENKEVITLLIEGQGDTKLGSDFSATAYLNIDDFPLEKLNEVLLVDAETLQTPIGASISSEIWFDLAPSQPINFTGSIDYKTGKNLAENEPLTSVNQWLDISVSSGFNGQYDQTTGLSLAMEDLTLGQTLSLDPLVFEFNHSEFDLYLESAQLDSLSAWYLSTFNFPQTNSVLQTLSPQGVLKNIALTGNVHDVDTWRLQAYPQALSVAAWQDVPSFNGVTGFVEATINGGSLILNSQTFKMGIERLFDQAFDAQQSTGIIDWRFDLPDKKLYLNGQDLVAENAIGLARGNFGLVIPLDRNYQESHVFLQLGLQNSSVEYLPQILPNKLDVNARNWIDQAILDGDVREAGVLIRTGMQKNAPTSVQVFADFNQGRVLYQEQWPELDQASGQLLIDNQYVRVDLQAKVLEKNDVKGQVQWNKNRRNDININLQVESEGEGSLQFIEQSPLKDTLQNGFKGWQIQGGLVHLLDLEFYLDDPDTLGKQDVTTEFSENTIYLSEQNLQFNNISGVVEYSVEKGVFSNAITGQLFDKPTEMRLSTDDKGDLYIRGDSQISWENLTQWLEQPELNSLAEGEVNYSFDVKITAGQGDGDQPISLNAQSDLKGLKILLPAPMNKPAEQVANLLVSSQINEGAIDLQAQVDNTFSYYLQASQDTAVSHVIFDNVNAASQKIKRDKHEEGFHIQANFKQLDVDQWWAYQQSLEQQEDDGSEIITYRISAEEIIYNEELYSQASVSGMYSGGVWENTIASDILAGNVFFTPGAQTPVVIDLDYLLWPSVDDEKTDADNTLDPWADIDFNNMENTQVTIDYLEFGGKPLGEWQLYLTPDSEQLLIDRISATYEDIVITGRNENASGAELLWTKATDGQQAATHFEGRVLGGSLKSLFDEWGLPPVLENEELALGLNLRWQGSPLMFDVDMLVGEADFEMKKGVFIQNETSDAEGLLRLVNLLNFDTWARRIRFDFSDVLSDGIVYDEIRGSLRFDQGVIDFPNPVTVQTPSLKFTFDGEIDNKNEVIDGELDVVLPVGGNLNLVTALTAGLPAAVGVFLVRKIFDKEFEKASTVTYLVTGDLNKPNVEYKNNDQPNQ